MTTLTQARLKELLHYDPDTGVWTWRVDCGRLNPKPGDVAGGLSAQGYWVLRVERRAYAAHRLAFLYMTGHLPADKVDHMDGDGLNNRWSNLRECSDAQNGCNRGANRNNTSGFKGVTWSRARRKWIAQITVNRRCFKLAACDTPEQAHAAYCEAAKRLHGEFWRAA